MRPTPGTRPRVSTLAMPHAWLRIRSHPRRAPRRARAHAHAHAHTHAHAAHASRAHVCTRLLACLLAFASMSRVLPCFFFPGLILSSKPNKVVWKAHIGPACASAPRRVSSAVARATAGKVLAGGCAHHGQSTRRGLTSPSMRGITSTIWLTSSWQRCRTRNRSRMNSHRTMHTHAAAAAEAAGLHTASIHSAICKKEPHHHLTKGPACLN